MMEFFKRFPWKIYLRFFFTQLIVYTILFIVILRIARIPDLLGEPVYHQMILAFFTASLFLALISSYRFVRPLQKVILKALRISSKKTSREIGFNNEDFLVEELGEYTELETALNRIARKLKKKKFE